MTTQKRPASTIPRLLQAIALICATVATPLATTYAQTPNVSAVQERLRRAVQAGELTPADARRMMLALKRPTQDPVGEADATRKDTTEQDYYKQLIKNLKEGIGVSLRAGKITEEEAANIFARQSRTMKDLAAKRSKQAELAKHRARNNRPNLTDIVQTLERSRAQKHTTKAEATARARKWLDRKTQHGPHLDITMENLIAVRAKRAAPPPAKPKKAGRAGRLEHQRKQLEEAKLRLKKLKQAVESDRIRKLQEAGSKAQKSKKNGQL